MPPHRALPPRGRERTARQWPGPPRLPPPPWSPPPPPPSSPPPPPRSSASASASTPGGLFPASGFGTTTFELLELEVAVLEASRVDRPVVDVDVDVSVADVEVAVVAVDVEVAVDVDVFPAPEFDAKDVEVGCVEAEEVGAEDVELEPGRPTALEPGSAVEPPVVIPPPPSGVSKSTTCMQPEASAPASPTRQTIRRCLMAMRAPPGARPPERLVRLDAEFHCCRKVRHRASGE